jgi:hypothetical protein
MGLAFHRPVDLTALVHRDVSDLIPRFLENRRQELAELRDAIAACAFDEIDRLGCRMYGAGNPFGFRQITTFGKQLREAAARPDPAGARRIVSQYALYLDKVQITLVDAPPKRKQWVPRLVERRKEERRAAPATGRACAMSRGIEISSPE